MNSLAVAEFERLKNAELFTMVGAQDTDAAKVLSSWKEAMEHCSSREWDDWLIDATNQIDDRVRAVAPARCEEWNDINHETKQFVIPVLEQKCERMVAENNLPKLFTDTVRWDVLHFFIEVAYSDIA